MLLTVLVLNSYNVRAEESTILDGAYVDFVQNMVFGPGLVHFDKSSLIDGNFKTYATYGTGSHDDGSIEMVVALPKPQTIVTAFIQSVAQRVVYPSDKYRTVF